VEYDGSGDGLFAFRRRDKKRRWLVFTRALLDKLFSYIITARTTYTAATRHMSSDVQSFALRRQDVVKLGTAMLRTLVIPPEAAICSLCGPDPKFIVIDGQAVGCTDPDDANPVRLEEECPVMDIPASSLCVLAAPPLRAVIIKVLRSSTALTGPQEELVRSWHDLLAINDESCVETAAARVFFRFFPLADDAAAGRAGCKSALATSTTAKASYSPSGGLESKLRKDEDGNITLGGKGASVKAVAETWRDRVGICSPDFSRIPKSDDGAWLHVRPFIQALLGETVSGMFAAHDESAVRLLSNSLRLQGPGKWRDVSAAIDGVGFLANFFGWFADEVDSDRGFRVALGRVLLRAVDMEQAVDDLFASAANKKEHVDRGFVNAEYCRKWGGRPTPADYRSWRDEQDVGQLDLDDPLVSFESFPGLERVRPGIKDTAAKLRRVGFKGKDRHAADVEGDGDACNKAFSIKCGLTQGVFNVVCPHVVTLGFRCLFRAESVGEALSIVLERFPKLPEVIFYDVACKLDKNALRRVRPILRAHGVRCILDRPHSITHTCSPIYMPDESLGSTAGVATQAAEVSHSIAVANRTSLAYMHPETYMLHKMLQVAMMNLRKLQRLASENTTGENDHVPLAPFFHSHISRRCQLGSCCSCAHSHVDDKDLGLEVVDPEMSAADGCRVPAGATLSADENAGTGASDPPTDEPCVNHGAGAEAAASVHPPHPPIGLNDGVGVDTERGKEVIRLAPLSTSPLPETYAAPLDALVANQSPGTVVRAVNRSDITLTVFDFARLHGVSWLTDTLMNSFVGLINHRDKALRAEDARIVVSNGELDVADVPRVFMFNTFFFSRLRERVGCYDYAGVRTWGFKNGLNIGEVDKVLIPVIVHNIHWVLVVVDVRRRSLLMYDPLFGEDTVSVIGTVRRWLRDEVSDRLGEEVAVEWDVEAWTVASSDGLPIQRDSGSCGVFVLATADCFALGLPASFTQDDICVLRQRMGLALLVDNLTAVDLGAQLSINMDVDMAE